MARILTEGWENVTSSRNILVGIDCTGTSGSGGSLAVTSTVGGALTTKNSVGAIEIGYGEGGSSAGRVYWTLYDTAASTDHYFSFDMRTRFGLHTQSATRSIMNWNYAATETSWVFKIMLVPTNVFGGVYEYRLDIVDSAGTTISTGTTTLYHSTYYRIEGFFDAVTNGSRLTLKIDGVVEHNSVLVGSSGKYQTHTVWLGPETPTNFTDFRLYFDNFRINDSSGSYNNTWLGEGYVAALHPASSIVYEWRTSAGGAGSTSNYTLVNDPDDTAITYVTKTTTLATAVADEGVLTGTVEEYTVENPAGLSFPIPINAKINCVSVSMVNGATGATSSVNRYASPRLRASNGGTVLHSLSTANETVGRSTSGQDWSVNDSLGNYDENNTRLAGAAPSQPSLIASVTPGTSTAWTYNNVKNAIIGVRAYNENATQIQVGKICLDVDWSPTAGNKRRLGILGVGV